MTVDELLEIELPQTIQKWEKLSLELSSEEKEKKLSKDLTIKYPKSLHLAALFHTNGRVLRPRLASWGVVQLSKT